MKDLLLPIYSALNSNISTNNGLIYSMYDVLSTSYINEIRPQVGMKRTNAFVSALVRRPMSICYDKFACALYETKQYALLRLVEGRCKTYYDECDKRIRKIFDSGFALEW